MNTQVVLLCITGILIGGNFYLHKHAGDLENEIAINAKRCEERLSLLQTKYENQLNTGESQIQPTPSVSVSNSTSVPAKVVTPKVNLQELVSHGHRVQAVTNKYEFLLVSAQLDEDDRRYLRRLLLKREQLANEIAFAEQDPSINVGKLNKQLQDTEAQIEIVLTDSLDFQRYEFLRDKSL